MATEQQFDTLVTEVLPATILDDFSAAAVVDFGVLMMANLATAVVDIDGCDLFVATVIE